ncbi:MAG: hypothetical protein KA536_10310 [Saprospiraceae bacterium]|nr:hypothetical protein [Saprospiraceae bacterium]
MINNIVIWDDIEEHADIIFDVISNYINTSTLECEVKIFNNPVKKLKKEIRSRKFDNYLLIIDLTEGNVNVAEGVLAVIKSVHNCNIKAIVITSNPNYSSDVALSNLKKAYPLIETCLKTSLRNGNKSELIKIIKKITQTKEVSQIKIDFEDDYFLLSLVEINSKDYFEIGIQDLVDKSVIYDSNKTFRIFYINQGLSGAIVIRIDYENEIKTSALLKIDRSKDNLKIELDNVKKYYMQLIDGGCRVDYLTEMYNFGDDYCLIMKFERGYKNLRDYYKEESFDLLGIVESIFLNSCHQLYNYKLFSDNNSKMQNSHILLDLFDFKRIGFLKSSVIELEKLSSIKWDDDLSNLFLRLQNEKTDNPFYGVKSQLIYQHMDLHSKNILIDDKRKFKIIDPANIAFAHWSSDLSMLLVDIFAHGIDAGKKEYFSASDESIENWYKIGRAIVEGKSIDITCRNDSVQEALKWMCNIENISKIYPDDMFTWGEFQLSLGMEFFRKSYKYTELPHGKRAACLMLGKFACEQALETFNPKKK